MPSYTRTRLKFSSNKSGGVTNLNLKLGVQMEVRFNSEYLQPSVKLSHGLWLLSASGAENHHVKTLGKQLIGKALNYQHDTDLADAGNRIKAYLGRKTHSASMSTVTIRSVDRAAAPLICMSLDKLWRLSIDKSTV